MPGKFFQMMQGVKNAQTIDEGYKAYHRQRDEFKK